MSDPNVVYVPAPGTLGLGVGRAYEDDFESVVWFPYSARAEAQEFADANPKWSLKEGVRL